MKIPEEMQVRKMYEICWRALRTHTQVIATEKSNLTFQTMLISLSSSDLEDKIVKTVICTL